MMFFFTPWKSDFIVDTAKKLTVEVKSTQTQLIKEGKPKMSVVNLNKTSDEVNVHVKNLIKIFKARGVTFRNLSENSKSLKKIIEVYTKKNKISENQRNDVINGIIQSLIK